jgi:tricorn protease-like protein
MLTFNDIEGDAIAFGVRADVPGWRLLKQNPDGEMYLDNSGMSVIVSGEIKEGKRWVHLSFARKTRMPSYADIQRVRIVFLGDDNTAIMVWPPKDRYVNLHPYCLHLWSCLDGDGLPEFSGLIAGVRSI